MKREDKAQVVAEVKEKAERAKSLFFADYTGITVGEVNELRREFRKSNVDYRVVKNTLARKALENVEGCDTILDRLVRPTAIAFAYDDPLAPAKIIKKFREKNEKLQLKVCVVERQVFEGKDLDRLAQLPSRPEMIAGILGSVMAPLSGIVGAINAVLRDLVGVVDAIEKKRAATSAS